MSEKRHPRFGYTLDQDHMRGFKTAVRNNQIALAMEHLVYIIDDLVSEQAPAEEEVPVITVAEEEEETPPAPAPKRTPRKAAATVPTEETSESE